MMNPTHTLDLVAFEVILAAVLALGIGLEALGLLVTWVKRFWKRESHHPSP